MEDGASLKMVEKQINKSTSTLLAEIGPSQNTINRDLYKVELMNKRCRKVPHKLTNDKIPRNVNLCKQLLENRRGSRFGGQIVIRDEKWMNFSNPKKRTHQDFVGIQLLTKQCQPKIEYDRNIF